MRQFKSHGSGNFTIDQIAMLGSNVIFEKDICIWHPETVSIGNNVYIGHRTMLKGHPKGKLSIANNVWIGQNVFIHSAGSVDIQSDVGIGPSVQILTSSHQITPRTELLLNSPLEFEAVCIETGADIGIGSIILPGVTIGTGAQVGAGSVVTKNVEAYAIVAGNPARHLRYRDH